MWGFYFIAHLSTLLVMPSSPFRLLSSSRTSLSTALLPFVMTTEIKQDRENSGRTGASLDELLGCFILLPEGWANAGG